MNNEKYSIFSYGFEGHWVERYQNKIIDTKIFQAKHFLVGEKDFIKNICQDNKNYILVNTENVQFHNTDYKLLSNLENISNRTIASIIYGDRVLKNRDFNSSIKYLSYIATNFLENVNLYKPQLVIGAKDSGHAVIVYMCCKLLNIPWIYAYYFALPPNRIAYLNDLNPGALEEMPESIDVISLKECNEVINKFKKRQVKYQNTNFGHSLLKNFKSYSQNLTKRIANKVEYNPYIWPTVKERIIDLSYRFKNRIKYPYEYLLQEYPKSKYIFFTLHMYPEATIDVYSPILNNQFALLDQISKSIPCTHKLVVKPHYLDPFSWGRREIINLINNKNVFFCNYNLDSYELIKNADLVLTIQGTSALEASLLGIPSIMFGDSPFKVFSTCKRSYKIENLNKMIVDSLKIKKPKPNEITYQFQKLLSRSEKVFDLRFDHERELNNKEIIKWRNYLNQVIIGQINSKK